MSRRRQRVPDDLSTQAKQARTSSGAGQQQPDEQQQEHDQATKQTIQPNEAAFFHTTTQKVREVDPNVTDTYWKLQLEDWSLWRANTMKSGEYHGKRSMVDVKQIGYRSKKIVCYVTGWCVVFCCFCVVVYSSHWRCILNC
jgi:hypothetical protein